MMALSTPGMDLPRLLADLEPVAAQIKQDYEDFEVEEVPLYPASGEGTHTYFLIEKRGLSTMQAAHDIAQALGVHRRHIGYAGLKDSRAVTRQWMSVEHVEPERLRRLGIPRIRVLEVTRHTNKLRQGHLAANRFVIRARECDTSRADELRQAMEQLHRRGVPNYFGPQRFGGRGDAWEVGRAIIQGRIEEAIDILLGRPDERDAGGILEARRLYEAGRYAEAVKHWPPAFRDERRALQALASSKGNRRRGFLAIDRYLHQFYVSAYQSYLFNRIVADRVTRGALDRLVLGDLAWIHGARKVFRVEDPAADQPRADAFEISPSGPLYGHRMTQAGGEPGAREAELLASEDLTLESFRVRFARVKGARRPLRFRPTDWDIRVGADSRGPYLELRFTLPRGCYATSLLRELFVDGSDGGLAGRAATSEEQVKNDQHR